MYQYRQVLVRMRQGDTDRDIERSGLLGRKKLSRLRKTAQDHDCWRRSVRSRRTPSWRRCSRIGRYRRAAYRV